MPLKSSRAFPERILVFGPPEVGKSTDWISIAELYQQTGTPSHFYVIDSDGTSSLLLPPGLDNVTTFPVVEWGQWREAGKVIKEKQKKGDWVIVDPIGAAWSEVQNEYSRRAYGADLGDFLMDHTGSVKVQQIDWQSVNASYDAMFAPILKGPAHVLATAQLVKPDPTKEKKETALLYSEVEGKPRGRSDLSYSFLTILLQAQRVKARFSLTTVKDKGFGGGRPKLKDALVGDSFALTYLIGNAGWELS